MDRRQFLKWLGIGAGVTVAPQLLAEQRPYISIDSVDATLKALQHADPVLFEDETVNHYEVYTRDHIYVYDGEKFVTYPNQWVYLISNNYASW